MKMIIVIVLAGFCGCAADAGRYGLRIEVSVPTGQAKVSGDGAWASPTNAAVLTLPH